MPEAVSVISTAAEGINDMIHIIVVYRVGTLAFNANKCDVTDALMLRGAAELSFQSAQGTE